jgi:hypothetical protein
MTTKFAQSTQPSSRSSNAINVIGISAFVLGSMMRDPAENLPTMLHSNQTSLQWLSTFAETTTNQPKKKDYRQLMTKMEQTSWYKETYVGKSLGDIVPVE